MAIQVLDTSDLRFLSPDSIEGLRAHGMRPRLDRALDACLGPGGAKLLADFRDNTGTGILEWRTDLPGTPVPRSSLGSEEMFRLDGMLLKAATAMRDKGARLSRSGTKEERVTGAFLRNIASSIELLANGGEACVRAFLVGDRPVVTGWGLRPSGEAKGFSEEPAKASAMAPAMAPAMAFAPPLGAIPPNLYESPQPPPEAGMEGGHGPWNFLRTAITALGTFLLLSILLFLFFPGLREYLAGSSLRYDPSEERRLQAELFGLREDYFEDLSSCASPGAREAELRLEPLPKRESLPDAAEPDPLPETGLLSVPAPPPPDIPPLSDTPTPPDTPTPSDTPTPPKPKSANKPPKPPKSRKVKPGDGFVIPADGNDMSFLEGCWRTAGLFNTFRQPVNYEYCFDSRGNGRARVEEFNRAGKHTDTCSGSVTATRRGKSVHMRDSGLRCRNGSVYEANILDCQGSTGGANRCSLRNSSGTSHPVFRYVRAR